MIDTIALTTLWLPVLLIPQLMFALGAAWLIASLGVFLRDIAQGITLLLMAWMYLTPIIYPESIVPERFRWFIGINPFTSLVRSYRRIFLDGLAPDWRVLFIGDQLTNPAAYRGGADSDSGDYKAQVVRHHARLGLPERVKFIGERLDADRIFDEMSVLTERLGPFIADTTHYLNVAATEGRSILLEGAQATLLDVDHGTYPFVTSSTTVAGGAIIGTGLAPNRLTGVLGIVRTYTTRVGEGPFPTEMLEGEAELGQMIRERGRGGRHEDDDRQQEPRHFPAALQSKAAVCGRA